MYFTKTFATLCVVLALAALCGASVELIEKESKLIPAPAAGTGTGTTSDGGPQLTWNIYNCGEGDWNILSMVSNGNMLMSPPQVLHNDDVGVALYELPEGASSYESNVTYTYPDGESHIWFYVGASYAQGGGSFSETLSLRLGGGNDDTDGQLHSIRDQICFYAWSPSETDCIELNPCYALVTGDDVKIQTL